MTTRLPPARALLFFLAVATAHATLSVTPQLVEVQLPQGARKQLVFTVVNEDTENERTVRYYPAPYRQKPDGAYEIVVDADPVYSCHDWFELDTAELVLRPGQGEDVSVQLRVPRGVSGTRFGAIAFEMLPLPAEGPWSIGLVTRMPGFVEVTIPGSGRSVPELVDVQFLSKEELGERLKMEVETGVLAIVTTVRNPGPVSVGMGGKILVRDAQGRRYREFPLGGGGSLLPGAEVEVLSVAPLPRSGNYSAEVTVEYGSSMPLKSRIPFTVAAGRVSEGGEVSTVPVVPVELNKEKIELRLPPRSTRFDYLVFTNLVDRELVLSARVTGLAGDGEGGLVPTDSVAPEHDGRGWVELESTVVRMPPNRTQALRISAQVPEAAVGGHYACLVFEGLPPDTSAVLTAPLLLSVVGDYARTAELVEVEATPSPVAMEISIRNTGDVHLAPKGRVMVRRAKVAEPVSQLDWEMMGTFGLAEAGVVLPGEELKLSGSFAQKLAPGTYRLDATVECGEGLNLNTDKTVRVR